MSRFQIFTFANDQTLADAAARRFLAELAARPPHAPTFSVALAGGRITAKFFSAVASLSQANKGSFDAVQFFWGDERCVPPTDPESNFALAERLLLTPLQIEQQNVHRIRGELPPAEAATEAAEELTRLTPADESNMPVLNLAFLGMGEDGHIASLFPGEPEEVIESAQIYRPVVASKPPPHRITLTYRTLARAKQVWVLASGSGKEAALKASLRPDGATPLARLLRLRSHTDIFTELV